MEDWKWSGDLFWRDILKVCVGGFFIGTSPYIGTIDKELAFWWGVSDLSGEIFS